MRIGLDIGALVIGISSFLWSYAVLRYVRRMSGAWRGVCPKCHSTGNGRDVIEVGTKGARAHCFHVYHSQWMSR